MNTRIFVEKKPMFATASHALMDELNQNLELNIASLRIIQIYDVFHIEARLLNQAIKTVFSEAATDVVLEDVKLEGQNYFCIEPLPGQFDQRADSARMAVSLLGDADDVIILSGVLYIFDQQITAVDMTRIQQYCLNPVESRLKDMLAPLVFDDKVSIKPVMNINGFMEMTRADLEALLAEMNLAMTLADIQHIQEYFIKTEQRNPTETEIRVLDTYWSDHCRHTTFETILTDIDFSESAFNGELQRVFDQYLDLRTQLGKVESAITLMDMATVFGKYQRFSGALNDLEVSDEINACSVEITVDVAGVKEPWLLMFKNETHNHPTEIEPFGGASTCIGGAIRDPLSGRSYVYQAMRITGSADIRESVADTMNGKLPQRLISKGATAGYSSYGNQIGLATTYVKEIYDEGYRAKHMEVGAVVGAVPKAHVRREQPVAGDIVLVIGGRTGRDGIGGATGSSKAHDEASVATSGSEVQKGNAPEERKLQRFFRSESVSLLIKKCNDFGAGGVSVAIGELADGLEINLDSLPVKYAGLNGTELALSESQERMAVVVAAKDQKQFEALARLENIEVTKAAIVTDDNYLTMLWQGKKIVSLSRAFLDTNGAAQFAKVKVESPQDQGPFAKVIDQKESLSSLWDMQLADINMASQKGMVSQFDASIGRSTVFMPYGGQLQRTPTQSSVQKLPVLNGVTTTVSCLAYGFDPQISSWSPFHGASYAVIDSVAKLVATGGSWQQTRFSFQEYFERLGNEAVRWGKPFAALLGALDAQMQFGLPAIGGKDSMSGSYQDIDVPPTLISFAVTTSNTEQVCSPEFKSVGSYVYWLPHNRLAHDMPDYSQLKAHFEYIERAHQQKQLLACSAVGCGGVAHALAEMSFGNNIGVHLKDITKEQLFAVDFGGFVLESKEALKHRDLQLIGSTIAENFVFADEVIRIEHLYQRYCAPLNEVYPQTLKVENTVLEAIPYAEKNIQFKAKTNMGKPRVYLPVFPGTNCEYDGARAFNVAGAKTSIVPFTNLTPEMIDTSIKTMVSELEQSQILLLSGGFSAGDEPDGSAKFIVNILLNEAVREAVNKFLERDGLILGICNGFQALVKSGLLPNAELGFVNEQSPTLFRNTVNRHISQMVQTKIISNNSPWLQTLEPGSVHNIAVSHGEGRFVANDDVLEKLIAQGQIATQYVDLAGNATMDPEYNPNGSMLAIEGLISPDGKIFGKMGHSERYESGLMKNISGEKEQSIFTNGVQYFL
ncbi:phosphoribosylformylglycinamidine synthase [Culicoidibacter larvae]|uniref:Phosphoribosylformylglycinamidine synthase n=1 Tax=Culicoidibacter larvae TaxID=2579976 RepID=A0A5R8QEB0_9FIRM|nr:phosphoribosylformylglycinamidine synthase [Culicoidibacter larvae]TLG74333.1 phosphoribosylformylglycinamidine synthase [Culicoidibacter larvae]